MARILVIGGAHIDRRATITGTAVAGASNPGAWHEEPGGGGFNAARNLANLGNSVAMVSVRGGDEAGERVGQAMEAAGIMDMAQVFLDRATPSYSAVLDQNGDLVIAVADMDLYDRFVHRQLSRKSIRQAIIDADFVLCDANLPAETLAALSELTAKHGKRLAAIAISPAKVPRLADTFGNLSVLFLNAAEANALFDQPTDPQDWPARLQALGITSAVITQGPGPLYCFDGGSAYRVTPPIAAEIVDVTGAGDALAAATIDALARGQPLDFAVRHGIAAALLAMRSPHASPPDLTANWLQKAAAYIPEPEFLS
ncbi:MAG: carbohydrate kinase family protein [Pseudomonadota bacterium]